MMIKIMELTGLFLMMDMKAEVEEVAIKMISKENIKDMCKVADNFSCRKLFSACVDFILEEGVDMEEEDVRQMPAVAAACLEVYKNLKLASEKRSASKSLQLNKEAEDYWAFKPTAAGNRLRKKLVEEAERRNADKKRRRNAEKSSAGGRLRIADLQVEVSVAGRSQGEEGLCLCPFCSRRCFFSARKEELFLNSSVLMNIII